MNEEILEQLLAKLIGLTEMGNLKWHFAGEVSKAYVTIYRDSRLKLTLDVLDITENEGETMRIESIAYSENVKKLLIELQKVAQESSGRFRTGQIKTLATSSLLATCQRLLEDNSAELVTDAIMGETLPDVSKNSDH